MLWLRLSHSLQSGVSWGCSLNRRLGGGQATSKFMQVAVGRSQVLTGQTPVLCHVATPHGGCSSLSRGLLTTWLLASPRLRAPRKKRAREAIQGKLCLWIPISSWKGHPLLLPYPHGLKWVTRSSRGYTRAWTAVEGISEGHLGGCLPQGFKSSKRQDKVRMHTLREGVCQESHGRDLKYLGCWEKEPLGISESFCEGVCTSGGPGWLILASTDEAERVTLLYSPFTPTCDALVIWFHPVADQKVQAAGEEWCAFSGY